MSICSCVQEISYFDILWDIIHLVVNPVWVIYVGRFNICGRVGYYGGQDTTGHLGTTRQFVKAHFIHSQGASLNFNFIPFLKLLDFSLPGPLISPISKLFYLYNIMANKVWSHPKKTSAHEKLSKHNSWVYIDSNGRFLLANWIPKTWMPGPQDDSLQGRGITVWRRGGRLWGN